MRRLMMVAVTAAAIVSLAVETPPPLVTEKGARGDAKEVRRAFDQGEFAIACSVKFDALPSKGAVTGLIDITADKDGIVKVRVPKAKTSLDRDFICYSRAKVKSGEYVIATASEGVSGTFGSVSAPEGAKWSVVYREKDIVLSVPGPGLMMIVR